jgi:CheY-like chemotaxis protein
MPVMNGFEFLHAYQQLPLDQKEAIVIIMLTTSLHPQDVERGQELNVAGFLSKPLTVDKVNGLLKQHFGRQLANG